MSAGTGPGNHRARRALLALASLVALAACAAQPGGGGYYPGPVAAQGPAGPAFTPEPPRARVALLLPLSGPQAPLGQAMLNATTLALFEHGNGAVDFVPRDTGGSAAGAAEAARTAMAQGARVIVGPLTAAETGGVSAQARGAGVPVLAFTNDPNQAGRGVWVMGVTPAQQVRRVVRAARAGGINRIALAAPAGAFGQQLGAALREAVAEAGMPPPVVVSYPAGAPMAASVRDLAQNIGEEGLGLLILAEGGARARQFVQAMTEAGLAVPPIRLAGTALWVGDNALAAEPALAGAWFPGPDPGARNGFESRYQSAFGGRPPRIAAAAYDAAALAARAARGGPNAPTEVPVGEILLGADGGLRLLADGQTQRALALYAIEPGGEPRVIDPAVLPEAGF